MVCIIGHAVQYPDEKEENDKEGQAKIVNGSAADAKEKDPRKACPYEAQGEESNAHVKCFGRW